MAYADAVTLSPVEIDDTGESVLGGMVAAAATANGNKMYQDGQGRSFFRVKNGSASPVTATVHATRSVDGLDLPDRTVTIAATGDSSGNDVKDIGPFPVGTFDQADGYIWITLSAITTVTICARKLKRVRTNAG